MRLLPQRTPLHQQSRRFLRPASQVPALQHGELLSKIALFLFLFFETPRLVVVVFSASPLELLFFLETSWLVVVVVAPLQPIVLS
jgi:hypothetical protein